MARSLGKAARSERPPIQPFSVVTWIRANLMSSWLNAILTILALWFLVRVFIALFSWALWDAAFGTTPASCEGIEGACWSFIADTWELYLVGLYPAEERWRPFLCLGILLLLLLASLVGRLRRQGGLFLGLWSVAAFTVFVLLRGGDWIGLKSITTDQWGGLVLTVILSIVGIAFAFPIGALAAIGRRVFRPLDTSEDHLFFQWNTEFSIGRQKFWIDVVQRFRFVDHAFRLGVVIQALIVDLGVVDHRPSGLFQPAPARICRQTPICHPFRFAVFL